VIFANDNWPPQLRAAVVRSILADAPETDDELFANDNNAQISGAKAHSWPAMRLNAGDGCEQNRAVLMLLSDLFELAAEPHDNVSSPAGRLKGDGELGLSALIDEVSDNDDGTPGNSGFGIDCCMREGTDLEALVKAGKFSTYVKEMPNGKKGGERTANFRIVHAWETTLINGKVVPVKFTSWGEYKTKRRVEGKIEEVWRRVCGERFTDPRGPDPKREKDYKASPHAIYPSGNAGATHVPYAADDPVDARRVLERLRARIGDEALAILRMAVVERSTARAIGEAMGKKYNAASALGTALIRKAMQAANDNLAALAEAS
jgi:hypothetical protein